MTIAKKIFFLSLVVLLFSLLLWGVYNLSFNKTGTPSASEDPEEEVLPKTKETAPSVMAVTDEAALSPVFTPDENGIKYYSRISGRVYQVDLDGKNKKTIADKDLIGLSDIMWSPDKTKVISKFNKADGVQFFYYSYDENRGVPIKDNVDEIAWLGTGGRIFYKYYEPKTKERSLNISDPDGTNWQKLSDVTHRNIVISPIPKTSLVSFWNKPDAFSETLLESVPTVGGEKKTIFKEKFGASYLWNKDGTSLLVSHTDVRGGSKLQLARLNSNGGEYRNLDAPTFVEKCAWSKNGKTIYYALPGGIPENAILPNDYVEGKFNTADTFWKLDTTTGEKSRIIELEELKGKFDASNLFLNTDESMLFFLNRIDGKVYRLAL